MSELGVKALVEALYEGLDGLSTAERERIFAALRERYCLHCGDADPQCQCQNDE